MRLVSVTLADIRRFTAPVTTGEFAPGLNVLAAPNEAGKSTLFDALRALFFRPHRSRDGEVTGLRPHGDGRPRVTVEVETAEGRLRLTKQWLKAPIAEVERVGRVVARADEAEAMIAALVAGLPGGAPGGLLWVRQGQRELDAERKEAEGAAARRDLLASVAGEVEALTGGRRMEAVAAAVRAALDDLVTSRGARAGGPLRAAEDEVAALEERRAGLAARVQKLHAALEQRRGLRRDLARIEAPEDVALRADRLKATEAADAAARAHAGQVETARVAADLAASEARAAAGRLAALQGARAEQAAAAAAQAEAAMREQAAGEAAGPLLAAAEATAEAARTAAAAARAAEGAELAAERAARAREAGGQRRELSDRLAKAEAQAEELGQARQAAAAGPDARAMARIHELAAAAEAARQALAAGAPAVRFDPGPGGDGTVLQDGRPLPAGRDVALPEGAVLALAGLGRLTLRPGQGLAQARGRLAKAEADLAQALAAAGAASVAAAHAAGAARTDAEGRAREAAAQLRALAPDGIEGLRARLAALPPPPDADAPDPPDPAAAAQEAEAARAREATAKAAAEAAAARAAKAAQAVAEARSVIAAATQRMSAAQAALDGLPDPGDAEAQLAAGAAAAERKAAGARAALEALVAGAPDAGAAAAALARARSAVGEAQAAAARARLELAGLDAAIEAQAGDGIEDELAEAEERLPAARARLARVEFERDMLRRLAAALDAARAAARERYLAPVTAELAPLLRMLWPGAELGLDDARLSPAALTRAGQEEAFDILSGGTQEQIALMVRLAFARLMARAGRGAPVILDDALVYTDDDRIEAMFDALHRQAQDLQILVLTCRQRAFRDLGGRQLRLMPVAGMP